MARSFLSVSDVSAEELRALLSEAKSLKAAMKKRKVPQSLRGRMVGLFFEKPSTRTRTSFEVATTRLGGHAVNLDTNELQTTRGEPIKDTARMLGRYLDGLVGRVASHETLTELAKYSGIPVINGLSDLEHPTQAVSDLFTIRELKGRVEGLTLAFIGDGDNVCNSLLLGCSMLGANMVVACPGGYAPNPEVLRRARENAARSDSRVDIVDRPEEAVEGADVLYTDVWVSMGEEREKSRRLRAFREFQINATLLRLADPKAIVMHCLPAHRGMEITDDVMEGGQSAVWQQAENKLYGAGAILELVLGS